MPIAPSMTMQNLILNNLLLQVIKKLGMIDESIAYLEPKQCLFRINRDVRFSKNKGTL